MSKRAKPGQHTEESHTASGSATHVIPDTVWVVFARRAYEEPLRQIGTVEADDLDLARVYARSIYDEFAWIEMAVVPRDALVTVIAS
jgi:hypothetical protein